MTEPKITAQVQGARAPSAAIPAQEPEIIDPVVGIKTDEQVLETAVAKASKRTVDAILDSIRETWTGLMLNIIETGKLLHELKGAAGHGNWLDKIDNDLPFDRSTAVKLMQIASHPVLSNAALAQHLPPKWSVLAEMISIPTDRLEMAIRQGVITPKTKREELRSLRWEQRDKGQAEKVEEALEPPPPPAAEDVAHARGVICVMAGICRVDASDIQAETRLSPQIAFARQMVYYCLSIQNDWNATRVGRAIARDRTTVEHGRIVIENMRDDPDFDHWLERACDILAAAQNLADNRPESMKERAA